MATKMTNALRGAKVRAVAMLTTAPEASSVPKATMFPAAQPVATPITRPKKPMKFSALVNTPIGVQATIDAIRSRLPTTVVSEAMEFLSVPRSELLDALRIPVSSFHRKLSTNQALSPEETERVMRLAEITRTSSEAFGGQVGAATWLTTANMALGGQSPLSLLDTDAGANQVRRVLAVVNYGGAL